MFKGSITALITPFSEDGRFDETAFRSLVDWQIAEGSHGLVSCGTTGESPTLSHDEHRFVTEVCIEEARGRIPVIAGCGSNSTTEAVALIEHAEQLKVDAALVVTPYYNKPSQEGLYLHFKTCAEATDLPIIIYNIPGRSVVDMSHDTMIRLAALSNIVGVKDATCDLARPTRVAIDIPDGFSQLSGEDATALAFLAQGGVGCISVTSNVAPRLCARMHEAWMKGDLSEAQQINQSLLPLHDALFAESNPAPVKYAVSLLGRCDRTLRPPLAPLSRPVAAMVREAMSGLDLFE